MGALIFAAATILLLVLATYLLQGLIWLLQAAIVLAVLAARVLLVVAGTAVWCAWWLFRRDGATLALRAAEAR